MSLNKRVTVPVGRIAPAEMEGCQTKRRSIEGSAAWVNLRSPRWITAAVADSGRTLLSVLLVEVGLETVEAGAIHPGDRFLYLFVRSASIYVETGTPDDS